MSYETHKAQLPPTELGDDRCLQMKYFGEGDIFIASWTGSLERRPTVTDGISKCFNLAHGSDLLLFASCVGYLRRINMPEEEVKQIILESGQEVLEDNLDMQYHHSGQEHYAQRVSEGRRVKIFDRVDEGLHCLVDPRPTRPGQINRVGATGIYTRMRPEKTESLVYASLMPNSQRDGVTVHETTDFCAADIPVMASLICSMAQGDYRKDLKMFIGGYTDE